MAVPIQVTFDCADPNRVATFWAAALDYELQPAPEGYASWEDVLQAQGVPPSEWNRFSAIIDPQGKGPRIYFQRVPEPKIVKNRVHLDVNIGGDASTPMEQRRARIAEAIERLSALGATQVRPYEENGEYWVVMRDPEDNEFCLQ